MPAPSVRLVGVVLLGLVVFAYGATSEVAWLFLLAYWCWTVAGAALAYELWNRRGLLVRVEVAPGEIADGSPAGWLPERVLKGAPALQPLFEGDTGAVRIALASTGAARGPARLRGSVGGVAVSAGFGRFSAAGVEETRTLGALSRGPLAASALTLEATDPAGLFRDRARLADCELAVVYPRFEERRRERRPREQEAAAPARRGGVGTEVFGVREYRPGDALRQVHWRLSARMGELIVREHEPPGLRTLLLVLDPAPRNGEVASALAREAAAEAWACQAAGGRVIAWAPGREPTAAEASIWPVLDWLARYPSSVPESDAVPRGAPEALLLVGAGPDEAGDMAPELRRQGTAVATRRVHADGSMEDLGVEVAS